MSNFNIERLIRKNIRQLQPYASARDEFKEFNKKMVFLDANENPFASKVNRYPDPQQTQLKEYLSGFKNCNPNQILLGNGSDEVLDLLFRAFCEPNKDNIITLPPTYGMYGVLAAINAIENKEVQLTENFQIKTTSIYRTINSKTKLLFICSPNNPTGNSIDNKAIENLLDTFSGIVVIDEAYIDFTNQQSWINRLQEFPNLVIIQTLSKAMGMAGIRLGICYASPEIITVLNKIKAPYNINTLTQQYALKALQDKANYKEQTQEIIKEREILLEQLRNSSIIKKIYPSQANFILIKVDDANLRYQQFIEKGIVVRNRSSQPLCNNCLRITVGTAAENRKLITELNTL